MLSHLVVFRGFLCFRRPLWRPFGSGRTRRPARIAYKLASLPDKQYEYASRKIDEVGRVLAAWGS